LNVGINKLKKKDNKANIKNLFHNKIFYRYLNIIKKIKRKRYIEKRKRYIERRNRYKKEQMEYRNIDYSRYYKKYEFNYDWVSVLKRHGPRSGLNKSKMQSVLQIIYDTEEKIRIYEAQKDKLIRVTLRKAWLKKKLMRMKKKKLIRMRKH